MKNFYFTLIAIFCNTLIFAQLTFTKQPVGNQLFTRNLTTNSAVVKFIGTVPSSSGYTKLTLETYRNDVLYNSITQNMTYTGGIGNFNFQQTIIAEKQNYSFRIIEQTGTTLYSVFNIVAGDSYIIQGQSNVAEGSGQPFTATNQFIRSYSSVDKWKIANMYLGGIAYHFADELTASQNIPIAIMNGAEGGQSIEYFQRNDANPTDATTNYGKLLNLYQASELGASRAIIWYQGENNSPYSTIAQYKTVFNSLYNAWKENYAFDKLYIFQIKGCVVTKNTEVFEALRQLPEEIPNSQIISTNGVDTSPADLCHYTIDGYKKFAHSLHNLAAYEIYNTGSLNGIVSPNVGAVKFTNSNKNQIEIKIVPSTSVLTWQAGVENQFYFSDETVSVTSGSIIGDKIILNLNKSFTSANPWAAYLGYLIQSSVAQPYIPNQNGLGLLSFKYRPIATDATLAVDNIKESTLEIYPNPAQEIISVKIPLNENLKSLSIYSMDGKKIMTESYATHINIKALPKSNYQIQVVTDKNKYSKKFIKN
ncbi:sialate O-acetylesterase [Soonwooa sp.]|uniref:sialate O-acetylesterase n=1 Tax=Soonwooa sp. TaxID=1938592 RepID=UPI00261152B6|nr:sialate O-acetylesterase [Soonwooa sp.]